VSETGKAELIFRYEFALMRADVVTAITFSHRTRLRP
jgi:hypothetical protein